MLALDLGVFHRRSHDVSIREALTWTSIWIALACLFGVGVRIYLGPESSLEFFTGFVVEKSLSVDNIFVIYMIFMYFKVPERFQHKVLFWGIIGALVMRAIFILAGIALIEKFHFIIYVFGAVLVLSGIKLLVPQKEEITLEKNRTLRVMRRLFRIAPDDSGKFFVRVDGKRAITSLFVALVMVETTDIIFAVDSIPAILAISTDPFIVYTSNAFAILGLRSLFFAVAKLVRALYLLRYGLAVILVFVGVKMVLADIMRVPTVIALSFILCVLSFCVIVSLIWPKKSDD